MEAPLELRNVVISTLGLLCNAGALLGLLRKKDVSRQFKVYTSSIIGVDLLVTCLMAVVTLIRIKDDTVRKRLCSGASRPFIFLLLSKSDLILAMAVDRLRAVFSPMMYRTQTRVMEKAVGLVILAFVAAIPTVLALFLFSPSPSTCFMFDVVTTYGIVMLGVHILVNGLVTSVIYVSLALRIKNVLCCRPKRLRPLQEPTWADRFPGRPEKTRALTVWSAIFVFFFCITYGPLGLYCIIMGLSDECSRQQEKSTVRFVLLTSAPFVSSVFDPVIVFWHLGGASCLTRGVTRCWTCARPAMLTSSDSSGPPHPRVINVRPAAAAAAASLPRPRFS